MLEKYLETIENPLKRGKIRHVLTMASLYRGRLALLHELIESVPLDLEIIYSDKRVMPDLTVSQNLKMTRQEREAYEKEQDQAGFVVASYWINDNFKTGKTGFDYAVWLKGVK